MSQRPKGNMESLVLRARRRFKLPNVALWTSETGFTRTELRALERRGYLRSQTSVGTFPLRRVWVSTLKLFEGG